MQFFGRNHFRDSSLILKISFTCPCLSLAYRLWSIFSARMKYKKLLSQLGNIFQMHALLLDSSFGGSLRYNQCSDHYDVFLFSYAPYNFQLYLRQYLCLFCFSVLIIAWLCSRPLCCNSTQHAGYHSNYNLCNILLFFLRSEFYLVLSEAPLNENWL